MHGAEWNDPAPALGLTPFYGEFDGAATARHAGIVIDVYKDGKMVRSFGSSQLGSTDGSAFPLKFKFAIFFPDEPGKSGQFSMDWAGRGLGRSTFDSDFNPRWAQSIVTFPIKEITGKTPLFAIITTDTNQIGGGAKSPEAVIKGNPKATIYVGYLVTK
ncbi:MAG TPA: hypothetical protein VG733_00175 [Chthoniobacteraceae bacterium]|nr:hypothetical protein [Chthoniobacteraceae bacterium]